MKNVYESMQIVAVFVAIIFTVCWAKNYGVGKLKALAITVISEFVGFMIVFLLTWIENGFKNFGAQNAVRCYPFLILFGFFEAWIFHMDVLRVCDFQAVLMPLTYGLGHFACLADHCCAGFYYLPDTFEYKIARALTGTYQLPMQVFESVSALIIFVIVVIYCVKTRFKVTGYAFALYHVLFGGTRFLWEFLRDNDKIITIAPMTGAVTVEGKTAVWGISNLAIWSLAILLVGVCMFIWLNKYNKRQV